MGRRRAHVPLPYVIVAVGTGVTEGAAAEGAWVAVPEPPGAAGEGKPFDDAEAAATRGLGLEPSSQTNAAGAVASTRARATASIARITEAPPRKPVERGAGERGAVDRDVIRSPVLRASPP
jgi:hypothetical protein